MKEVSKQMIEEMKESHKIMRDELDRGIEEGWKDVTPEQITMLSALLCDTFSSLIKRNEEILELRGD